MDLAFSGTHIEAIGAPIPPIDRAAYEQAVTTARRQARETSFAAAWAQGRTMTPAQALSAQTSGTVPEQKSRPTLRPSYPAGLTAREVEVLCLVSQGWTDAQIANRLVISPRTVNAHLNSIYRKIDVSSRNAAAHYALEHRLV